MPSFCSGHQVCCSVDLLDRQAERFASAAIPPKSASYRALTLDARLQGKFPKLQLNISPDATVRLTLPAQGFTVSSDVDPQAGAPVVNATSAVTLSGQGAGSVAVLDFQVKAAA